MSVIIKFQHHILHSLVLVDNNGFVGEHHALSEITQSQCCMSSCKYKVQGIFFLICHPFFFSSKHCRYITPQFGFWLYFPKKSQHIFALFSPFLALTCMAGRKCWLHQYIYTWKKSFSCCFDCLFVFPNLYGRTKMMAPYPLVFRLTFPLKVLIWENLKHLAKSNFKTTIYLQKPKCKVLVWTHFHISSTAILVKERHTVWVMTWTQIFVRN